MTKPAYRVPSMAEVEAVPDTGLRVVSTFSGAGGSCLGYRMAGMRVLWASEFVPAAAEVYRLNHPGTHLDTRDIREVSAADIKADIGGVEVDLLDGSPPCASFSTAGKRSEHWGLVRDYSDRKQRTDDLFFEFARILTELQPRTFVAENVAGLVRGSAKGYFKEILAALRGAGYTVAARLLDAQWLGVPQARRRVIFQGVREDLGRAPAFPKPLSFRYAVRDALPHVGSYRYDTSGQFTARDLDVTQDPAPAITISGGLAHYHHKVTSIDAVSGFVKGKRFSLDVPAPVVMAGGMYGSGRHQVLVTEASDPIVATGANAAYGSEGWRPADAPVGTIGASPQTGNGRSPSGEVKLASGDRRKFTIDELKAICAFPPDFQLVGSYAQQWERLGRAVPPLMMRAIAEAVRDNVLCAG